MVPLLCEGLSGAPLESPQRREGEAEVGTLCPMAALRAWEQDTGESF